MFMYNNLLHYCSLTDHSNKFFLKSFYTTAFITENVESYLNNVFLKIKVLNCGQYHLSAFSPMIAMKN